MEVAVRYSNPPVQLETLLYQLPNWVRSNRAAHAAHVPVLLEQRLGRAAVDDLIAAYRAGATKHEPAKRYKIGRTSVHDLLRRYKIESRSK